jgi:hypothetical protein
MHRLVDLYKLGFLVPDRSAGAYTDFSPIPIVQIELANNPMRLGFVERIRVFRDPSNQDYVIYSNPWGSVEFDRASTAFRVYAIEATPMLVSTPESDYDRAMRIVG